MGLRQSLPPEPDLRPPTSGRLVVRVGRRLADDRGMALAIAVGVMLVLSITVTSVISYTSAGSRSTNISSSGQKASSLAEAGMNNALSVLASSGTDATAMRPQPAYAGDTNATVTSYVGGGTATWGANYTAGTRTWTIKSIGSVPNPTGPGPGNINRTLYGTAVIAVPPYSFVALNSTCDKHTLTVRSSGVLTVTNAMYTNSCDMGHDAFDVFGAGGSISAPSIQVVGGWETHNGSNVIVNGVTCPLLSANPPALGNPGTPTAGCPTMGQPVLPDPFVNTPTPALDATPACAGTSYGTATAYSPAETLTNAITNVATSTVLSGATAIANGDIIAIEAEWLVVTGVTIGGTGKTTTSTITFTRAFNGTLAAAHNGGKAIKRVPILTTGTAASPGQCKKSSGTVTLQPGTYYGGICIGVPAGGDCTSTSCVPNDPYNAAAYSPAETFDAAITDTATSTVTNGVTPAEVGDVVKIENEWLVITGITIGGTGKTTTSTITFTRGALGSTPVAHAAGKAVLKGTPAITANVTLTAGTYIMAGGGFHVCGASSLSAPNVLIYNTQDPTNTAGAGALDSILVNTGGSVSLGPQTLGTYAGLTIFQDRTLGVDTATSCDSRGKNATVAGYDIGFLSAASTGANGALGSVSGTIYSPLSNTLFVTQLSGRANLAVMTSCILIDGGNQIFDFQMSGLYGVGLQLGKQWG